MAMDDYAAFMTGDFSSLLEGIASGGPLDQLELIEKNGLVVSTANTVDSGWETAVWQDGKQHDGEMGRGGIGSGIYIVESYENEGDARQGHEKWGRWAEDIEYPATITDIGYGDLIPPKEVTLHERSA